MHVNYLYECISYFDSFVYCIYHCLSTVTGIHSIHSIPCFRSEHHSIKAAWGVKFVAPKDIFNAIGKPRPGVGDGAWFGRWHLLGSELHDFFWKVLRKNANLSRIVGLVTHPNEAVGANSKQLRAVVVSMFHTQTKARRGSTDNPARDVETMLLGSQFDGLYRLNLDPMPTSWGNHNPWLLRAKSIAPQPPLHSESLDPSHTKVRSRTSSKSLSSIALTLVSSTRTRSSRDWDDWEDLVSNWRGRLS